jgi:hypothetical protein
MYTSLCHRIETDLIQYHHTRAIISRGLYTFYPISKDHLCTVNFGLMYGLYSRVASNQERPMMGRVQYIHLIRSNNISRRDKNWPRQLLKVAFIQKVLVHLSFPQTGKPYYFPELEF